MNFEKTNLKGSKPSSIASVALSQDYCWCGVTLEWQHLDSRGPMLAMWISHLCGQVFYIKPPKWNKRRCYHASNLIKLIPQCFLHDMLLFVVGHIQTAGNLIRSSIPGTERQTCKTMHSQSWRPLMMCNHISSTSTTNRWSLISWINFHTNKAIPTEFSGTNLVPAHVSGCALALAPPKLVHLSHHFLHRDLHQRNSDIWMAGWVPYQSGMNPPEILKLKLMLDITLPETKN